MNVEEEEISPVSSVTESSSNTFNGSEVSNAVLEYGRRGGSGHGVQDLSQLDPGFPFGSGVVALWWVGGRGEHQHTQIAGDLSRAVSMAKVCAAVCASATQDLQ